MLEAQALSVRLGRQMILHDVSLRALPGNVLALIGPNGAGKSTLLRALTRLLRPCAGQVRLEHHSIWQLPSRAVARRLAFAPQIAVINDLLTVEQIVALGRAPHRGWLLPYTVADRAVVRRVMHRLQLDHLGERTLMQLSGGEQRRVILARALAQEPDVLVLDEPTAHLDLKYQLETLELVQTLAHADGFTVIVALHDLQHALRYADQAVLLRYGRVLAAGAVHEVITPDHVLAAYDVHVTMVPHPIDGSPLITPLNHMVSA